MTAFRSQNVSCNRMPFSSLNEAVLRIAQAERSLGRLLRMAAGHHRTVRALFECALNRVSGGPLRNTSCLLFNEHAMACHARECTPTGRTADRAVLEVRHAFADAATKNPKRRCLRRIGHKSVFLL